MSACADLLFYLKPSPRHGIGVFAARRIAAGRPLPLFAEKDWRWLPRAPRHIGGSFCTKGDGGFYQPADWHRMSIGWYLNHSSRPNVCAKTWRSVRPIRAGDELTISYVDLGEVAPTAKGERCSSASRCHSEKRK